MYSEHIGFREERYLWIPQKTYGPFKCLGWGLQSKKEWNMKKVKHPLRPFAFPLLSAWRQAKTWSLFVFSKDARWTMESVDGTQNGCGTTWQWRPGYRTWKTQVLQYGYKMHWMGCRSGVDSTTTWPSLRPNRVLAHRWWYFKKNSAGSTKVSLRVTRGGSLLFPYPKLKDLTHQTQRFWSTVYRSCVLLGCRH